MQAPYPPYTATLPARLRSHGFTLIELLIAISILAAMTVISWRGIDGMVRSQQQAKAHSEATMVVQAALAQWSTDLNAIERVANTTPLDWNGSVLRITRRSSDITEQGVRVVAWSLRERQGQRYWARWQSIPVSTVPDWQTAWELAANSANTADTNATQAQDTLLMPVRGWQLLYYRGNSWANPLSAGTVSQPADVNNPTTSTLPDGVRLSLDLPAPGALAGSLTIDWVNPLLGGNKS